MVTIDWLSLWLKSLAVAVEFFLEAAVEEEMSLMPTLLFTLLITGVFQTNMTKRKTPRRRL